MLLKIDFQPGRNAIAKGTGKVANASWPPRPEEARGQQQVLPFTGLY